MRGSLFVVSAPSGCGKTTILKEVQKRVGGFRFSVSSTTRHPRQGEVDGVDYFFVSKDEFLKGIKEGRFLEWALVHGNYYGTDKTMIDKWLEEGFDVVLDIDFQGARKVKAFYDCTTIFILPPSWEELKRRLSKRGTESEEAIKVRLSDARREVEEAFWYDFVVVNDSLESAIEEVASIIRAFRCKTGKNVKAIEKLIDDVDFWHSSL